MLVNSRRGPPIMLAQDDGQSFRQNLVPNSTMPMLDVVRET